MTRQLRHPQPVGVFGLPAGFLLVPDTGSPAVAAAHDDLVAGRLPRQWPDDLRFHELVHAGNLDAAREVPFEGEPLTAYHSWVLDPDPGAADAVRGSLPESVRALVDIVLAATGQGPAPQVGDDASAEIRALARAAQATEALGRGDLDAGLAGLHAAAQTAAATVPALAAVLTATAAMIRHDAGDGAGAAAGLAGALADLTETDLPEVRADVALRLGSISQEAAAGARNEHEMRERLQEAMGHYYAGLHAVDEESAPFLWASLNLNLATAHLSAPMTQAGDQLRLGVAMQSLRACRRVFTPQEAPAQWASATLNLANALVYSPSTHQGDNLAEAIGLYDEILASGVRSGDDLARARLLTNRGNALAHAGAFDDAHADLAEARYLFETHLDHDGALTVRAILDEVRKAQVEEPDDELADLAQQAEQMGRMPQPTSFNSGMGVRVGGGLPGGIDSTPPPKATVTILDAATRPTPVGDSAEAGGLLGEVEGDEA